MKKLGFLFLTLRVMHVFAQPTPETLGLKVDHQISANPVQDQSMSSTCWSFASNSFLESELMRNSRHPVKLSEMFIARYSYINKVYQYLAQKGKVFFTPGGQFHDVLKVVRKYGMVPEEIYNGQVTHPVSTIYNHDKLDTAMHMLVLKLLAEGKKRPDKNDLLLINQLLNKYIGVLPTSFFYQGKKYSPVSFTSEFLHFNPSDYVEITSYTHHPPYTKFVLEDKFNWTLDSFNNVPLTDFMAITDSALKNGFTVCWDGDSDEPGFKYEQGLAYLLENQESAEIDRQSSFEDKTTSIDHMMHVIGTATDKNNNKWYYVKNSWGNFTNAYGGYLFMQREYFKIKTVAFIVNKNAIPASIRKKMKL